MKHRASLALIVGLLSVSLLGGIAQAQTATRVTDCSAATPNNAICIVVTAPAAPVFDVNGTPTALALTYRVEQKVGTASFATVASALTSLKYYAQNLAPGDYVWRVYANCVGIPNVVNCAEGPVSNSATKSLAVPVVTPGAPVIVIAATIRDGQPPVYRIIQSVNLKPNEVVMVAPAEMRPLFANR